MSKKYVYLFSEGDASIDVYKRQRNDLIHKRELLLLEIIADILFHDFRVRPKEF